LPWWRVNEDGSYVLFVRVGSKLIEFEKGKNAVAVPSLDKMPLVINILITAVRNGELDQQLAQTKKPAVLRYLKTAWRRNDPGEIAEGVYTVVADKAVEVWDLQGRLLGTEVLRPGDGADAVARKILREKSGKRNSFYDAIVYPRWAI
jgi:hypothetical protein